MILALYFRYKCATLRSTAEKGGLNLIPVKIEKAESLCYNIQLHWTLFLR